VVDEKPKPNPWNEGMRWASAIMSCGLEIVLASGAGYWVDQKLNTLPWFTAAGMLLGLFAASYHLYILLRESPGTNSEE
jgi:F0F1-type ATP synthase assembly protein I